jgi:hypothetical protein
MTVKRPFWKCVAYQGVSPVELGRQYTKAHIAGRLDIVAEIDVFVFESGQFGESDIDEFLAASAEVEQWDDEEQLAQFEDEQLAQTMLSCGINPFYVR